MRVLTKSHPFLQQLTERCANSETFGDCWQVVGDYLKKTEPYAFARMLSFLSVRLGEVNGGWPGEDATFFWERPEGDRLADLTMHAVHVYQDLDSDTFYVILGCCIQQGVPLIGGKCWGNYIYEESFLEQPVVRPIKKKKTNLQIVSNDESIH